MGLDMYLSVNRYVSGWNHATEKEKTEYAALKQLMGVPEFTCQGCPSGEVELNVAYWRKANAIHRWFVEKTQGGVDECQKSEVSRAQLEELLALCKQIIAGEKACEALPTQAGFFFGSTDHDEGFKEDVQDTVNQLEKVLSAFKDDYFTYQASW